MFWVKLLGKSLGNAEISEYQRGVRTLTSAVLLLYWILARIALTTFGSLGDLHPYIAVGLGLRARGHSVTIATSESYRIKVEREGLEFHPVRPESAWIREDAEVMRRAFHPRTGSEYILRKLFLPWLEQSYEDLMPLAQDSDLLVGHPIAFATPIVAEKLNKPWVSVILQPSILLSAFDPPAVSGVPQLEWFLNWGPWFWARFFNFARRVARHWGTPINRFRRQLGLREVRDPVLDDMFSPFGNLAWFSKVMAQPQRDWPAHLEVTGYTFYDRSEPGHRMSAELDHFLKAGPPPVVFTLGSSAVFDAGAFYKESLAAVSEVGCRAVLLIGQDPRNVPKGALPSGVITAEYAPYSELLPRAAATVHQGGSGTTAQALASGKPMLVIPWSHDQPDNARRVVRLGVARTIPRNQLKASRIATDLKLLLNNEGYLRRAEEVASVMALEDGVENACDALERKLSASHTS